MAQAALDQALVVAGVALVKAWRAKNHPGQSSTFKRQLAMNLFLTAVADPRLSAPFDPDVDYTVMGPRGIEEAWVHLDKSLATLDWADDAEDVDAKRTVVIETVDIMLQDVRDDQYATIFGIAKATYDPRWIDEDGDFIEDILQAPVLLDAVSITGDIQEGEEITAVAGDWTGGATFEYAFFIDGEEVQADSATATYTVAADTEGLPLRVRVTATNDAGSTIAWTEENTILAAA